jgi:cytochrome c oxidase subunit 2
MSPLGYLDAAGARADVILPLTWFTLIVSAAVCIVIAALLWAGIRRRHATMDIRSVRLERGGNGLRWISLGVLISAVPLFITLVWTMVALAKVSGPPRNAALTLDVTGHEWWWEVRYNAPRSSEIFTTANEIHIPVGVPVLVRLHGADVIHSFWVPNLAGKKDLIPGKINTIWIQADKPGVYRGQCAEYCGLQHAKMALWVVAEPQEQFNAWRQNQTQQAVSPASDTQKPGQQVFFGSTCVMCHAISGTPAGSNIGPNLTHVGSRQMIAAATLVNTREHMAQWIKDSQMFKPGNKMPQHNFSDADLQSLVDYLQSLK